MLLNSFFTIILSNNIVTLYENIYIYSKGEGEPDGDEVDEDSEVCVEEHEQSPGEGKLFVGNTNIPIMFVWVFYVTSWLGYSMILKELSKKQN